MNNRLQYQPSLNTTCSQDVNVACNKQLSSYEIPARLRGSGGNACPEKETSFLNHIVDSADGDTQSVLWPGLWPEKVLAGVLFVAKSFDFVSCLYYCRGSRSVSSVCWGFEITCIRHSSRLGISPPQGFLSTDDRHPCPHSGNRTRNPNKRAAADPQFTPRGYWNRHLQVLYDILTI
jgi:hypothetical protein